MVLQKRNGPVKSNLYHGVLIYYHRAEYRTVSIILL